MTVWIVSDQKEEKFRTDQHGFLSSVYSVSPISISIFGFVSGRGCYYILVVTISSTIQINE